MTILTMLRYTNEYQKTVASKCLK